MAVYKGGSLRGMHGQLPILRHLPIFQLLFGLLPMPLSNVSAPLPCNNPLFC